MLVSGRPFQVGLGGRPTATPLFVESSYFGTCPTGGEVLAGSWEGRMGMIPLAGTRKTTQKVRNRNPVLPLEHLTLKPQSPQTPKQIQTLKPAAEGIPLCSPRNPAASKSSPRSSLQDDKTK